MKNSSLLPNSGADSRARIDDVDALRGFALFGILQVNIMAFASVLFGLPVSSSLYNNSFDQFVELFISSIFAMKFYLLFSFLFGYSVTLQMQSAQRAGERFIPRFWRRQAGLWIIGLAHAALLFHGDILTTYAVLGIILLLWRNQSDRVLLKSAIWLIGLTTAVWTLAGLFLLAVPAAVNETEILQEAQLAYAAYSGSFRAVVMQHISELKFMWIVLVLIQAPCALAMFLLGFLAGKHQFLAQPAQYRPYLKPAIQLGLGIGLPASIIAAWMALNTTETSTEVLGLALSLATAPLLTFALIALMLKLFATKHGQFWRDALAPAGRMALSNYLLQSLICGLIFYGYGFGLINKTSNLTTLLIGVAIFVVQLFLSRWWMRNYYYGPVEWLLRALTIADWPQWQKPKRKF